MLLQLDDALLQCFQILRTQICLCHATVVFQCTDGCDQYYGIGSKSCLTALDVEEFLCPQVCAEAGFCDAIVRHLHGCFGGSDGVTSVGDVGKRASVYQCGSML